MQYAYDANGRQKWSANFDGTNQVTAVFDGAGQRVGTISGGVLTNVLVYDAMGKLIAEHDTTVTSTTHNVRYVSLDHQGSIRIVMDDAGGVLSRLDYQAFGDEIYAGVGQRQTTQGFSSGYNIRQKFAGMERDEATGMAHTLWRKYDSLSGRWSTPDPYGGSMEITSPQTFNRYSYVNNDPVNLVDPTGLALSDIGVYQTQNERVARALDYQLVLMLRQMVNQGTSDPPAQKETKKQVVDVRNDPSLKRKISEIEKKSKPLEEGEAQVPTTVEHVVGDLVILQGATVIGVNEDGTPIENVDGYMLPVAVVVLDQKGNIIKDPNMSITETVKADPNSADAILLESQGRLGTSNGIPKPQVDGVFYDVQLRAPGRASYDIVTTQQLDIKQGRRSLFRVEGIKIHANDAARTYEITPGRVRPFSK